MRHALVGLALLVAGAHRLSALEPPGSAVALERSRGGLPVVVVHAGAETLRFAIDTGSSRTLVSPGAAARLSLVPREAFPVAWVGGAPRAGLSAAAPQLRVGAIPLTVDGLGWVPSLRGVTADANVDGLLGADALATVSGSGSTRAPAGAVSPRRASSLAGSATRCRSSGSAAGWRSATGCRRSDVTLARASCSKLGAPHPLLGEPRQAGRGRRWRRFPGRAPRMIRRARGERSAWRRSARYGSARRVSTAGQPVCFLGRWLARDG